MTKVPRLVLLPVAWFVVLFGVRPVNGDVITYQAEAADDIRNIKFTDQHEGFDGTGYADFGDDSSLSYISWEVYVPSTGDHKITLRYASRSSRPVDMEVDGVEKGVFPCTSTDSWTNWNTETLVVSMNRGPQTMRLSAPAGTNGPNVDWISIESDSTELPPTTGETTYYEAEDAQLNKVKIDDANSGYRGSGYADFQDQGAYIMWDIEVAVSGAYEIAASFASASTRECDLIIDGRKMGVFEFIETGSWSTWKTDVLVVSMDQGSHSLKILAATSTGPNIDWLSVRPCGSTCSKTPVSDPTPSPVARPTSGCGFPEPTQQTNFPMSVVLESNERLERGQFVFSPNGEYKVGLAPDGNLVLQDKRLQLLWSTKTPGGHRCYMQRDGNLVVRAIDNQALWASGTQNNPGARLIVDDGGRVAVTNGGVTLWLDGIPRGKYLGPSSQDLDFPVRGIFYYPWYPETWTLNGHPAKFEPELGLYSSSNPQVTEAHIDALEYAWIGLSIASWWGPDTKLDRPRLTMLMDQTLSLQSDVKWTIYYERERDIHPSPIRIKEDLNYLKKWFAWHPAWAHRDGLPVIFVYNDSGCDVPNRWMEASMGEWFVVLKIFPGFKDCRKQPNHWHQYGVASDGNPAEHSAYSVTIAPGFWRADQTSPLLPRLSKAQWCQNVKTMTESNAPLHLIVSFNEAGEGTMIEASPSWASSSGYGYYLDCLHLYPEF